MSSFIYKSKTFKKKDHLDERKCINKLHQRRFNEKMTIIKCQKIINKNENLLKRSDNFHKYLRNKDMNSRQRRARIHINSNLLCVFESISEHHR